MPSAGELKVGIPVCLMRLTQRFDFWLLIVFGLFTPSRVLIYASEARKETAAQQKLPPIYLNHASLLVSSSLYKAIYELEFLKTQFSNSGESTVTGAYTASNSYTNFMVRGKSTYLELKDSGSLSQNKLQRNVILFIMSIDDRTQLPAVSENFERNGIHAPIEIATRVINGREVKWHDNTGGAKWEDNPDPSHTPWFDVAAIYPGYLKEAYPDLKPGEDGTTRENYNARKYKPDLLMQDITGFDIDITRDQLSILGAQFNAMGYEMNRNGKTTTASGPGVTFQLRVVELGAPRVVDIHFLLNRKKEGEQVYNFPSNSRLRFNGNATATWTFPEEIEGQSADTHRR
jgi:Family of unknown function (DUF5829)